MKNENGYENGYEKGNKMVVKLMIKLKNKSFITNGIGMMLFLIGWYMEYYTPTMSGVGIYIRNAGLFAVAGAFTNWLAVYMLFERVPFLYGSGVIPNNFEVFKSSIKDMIMSNFFSEENFDILSQDISSTMIHKEHIIEQIDENLLFEGLVETIKTSSIANMLAMIGGDAILEQFRKPFCIKIKAKIETMLDTIDMSSIIDMHSGYGAMKKKVETMIDTRLETLSSEEVKHIVEDMIKKHLGWLVVWGGFFGGILGIISTIFII